MRKMRTLIIVCILLVSCMAFVACNDNQEVPKNQLERPIITSIDEDGLVSWESIKNANRYEVYINGAKAFITKTNSCNIVETNAGEYIITIKACDAMGKYNESEMSEGKVYTVAKTKLSAPNISIDGKVISWDKVTGATTYKVYINDLLVENASIIEKNGKITFTANNCKAGDYFVNIVAVDNTNAYRDSNASNRVTFTVIAPDTLTFWDYDTMGEKWIGSGTLSVQGYNMVVGAGVEKVSTENFVSINENMKFFKIAFMRFSDDVANPNVYLYVKGNADQNYNLVKAIGVENDFVSTLAVNQTYKYAYDLNSYSGNVNIKIVLKSAEANKAATACFQAVGFSEYGVGNHTTTKTSWAKGEVFIDWNFSNACGYLLNDQKGLLSIYPNGYIENTMTITEATNCLEIEAGAKLNVYVDNSSSPLSCVSNGIKYIYDLSSYVGKTISLKSKATELTPVISVEVNENLTVLFPPTININENIVSWNAVTNATGYIVYINDVEVGVSQRETMYAITEINVGEYAITVKAVNSTTESAISNSVVYKIANPDSSIYWDYDNMLAKWSGENSLTAQGYNMVVGAGVEKVSTENFVSINENMKFFKIAFMRFSDDVANPNIYLYVKGNADQNYNLVKAIGVENDFVSTLAVNQTYKYAYDLSSYSGNVNIKIVLKSAEANKAATACFQAVGFSEYGVGNHTTTKTSWAKGEVFIDWNFSNACGWVLDNENGLLSIYVDGYIENTITLTAQTNCLKIVAGSKLDLYVNDSQEAVKCFIDGKNYLYDLSSFAGTQIKIKGKATALTQIVSIELINHSFADTLTYWNREGFANWNKSGFNALHAEGFELYIPAELSDIASIENYVAVPQNMKYFKVVFMSRPVGCDESNPAIFVEVKKDNENTFNIIKAMGSTNDYVTATGDYILHVYTYDLSAYSGNITIKISNKRINDNKTIASQAVFQAVGFSKFGETEHITDKTSWSKGEVALDWTINNSTVWVVGDVGGLVSVYPNGFIENKIEVTNLTNCLKIEAVAKLEVYVDGSITKVNCINDGMFYRYDLSEYVGKTVTVKGVSSELTQIISIELISMHNQ